MGIGFDEEPGKVWAWDAMRRWEKMNGKRTFS
jgi:hypothetical protein